MMGFLLEGTGPRTLMMTPKTDEIFRSTSNDKYEGLLKVAEPLRIPVSSPNIFLEKIKKGIALS